MIIEMIWSAFKKYKTIEKEFEPMKNHDSEERTALGKLAKKLFLESYW